MFLLIEWYFKFINNFIVFLEEEEYDLFGIFDVFKEGWVVWLSLLMSQ